MKGSVVDVFFVLTIFFFIATFLLMIIGYTTMEFVSMMGSSSIIDSTTMGMINQISGTYYFFDLIISMMVFILIIFTWVLGYNIKANPLNFPIGLIILIVLTFLSFPISNLQMKFLSMAPINTFSVKFPFIIYIAANLPTILFVSTLIYLVVSVIGYAK